ncbi:MULTISPECIES: LysR family transcriptional regulator [unclassified Sphingomonas]|jgi:DNA-binding transcriptional LysR family regulator|uniref:LysR family transcriptional regulator n=1 Tax=unclassified Sphingomonas TaxID=196159 RepID=UPI0006F37182|nr:MULTISPECIES: LysR family transcriptional regulator [unclassified Sphingomonas]KQN25316.1 LysR family transcriptional regulator [Sphingomonas sp. Leaf33]MBD8472093.1 LysR family transcriptional regulator [Sphingomonas sp. CFBP 8765]
MARENLNDLVAFVAVARERSFTRAAAQLGVSQSALSHTLRALEERIGVRLLTRTTRSVVPTEAGDRLLATVGNHLDGIEAGLAELGELRDKPAGHFRITSTEHAAETLLWPAMETIANSYPDITLEIVIDVGLSNIVTERYDAGVRIGEAIEKDMIAVRIGPDLEMAVVGTPAYLEARGLPESPQDLVGHNCINLRLVSAGALYAWEFEKDGRQINVRVDGQFTFNTSGLIRKAALAGHGLASIPVDQVQDDLASGRLVRVLADWCPPFSGYHLYYPSRRQNSLAFRLLVDALRLRS